MNLRQIKLIKVKRPKMGDVIAVVSPSGPVKKSKITKSVQIFEKHGFRLEFLPSAFKKDRYLAGNDRERFEDLIEALTNPKYNAVICTRGGYGSLRLIEMLSSFNFKEPKPFFGFSDITALHIFLNKRGWVTFHSPNLNGFNELSDGTQRYFFDYILNPSKKDIQLKGRYRLYGGNTTGVLCGGNLSIISSLCGTRYDLQLDGKILLIEDVNEEPYRIDRMLTQLLLREDVMRVGGVVFGKFTGCGRAGDIREILKGFADKLKKPTIYEIDVGHIKSNLIVPLNIRYFLDADKITLTQLEDPFL